MKGFLFLVLSSFPAFAFEYSAYRPLNRDYSHFEKEALMAEKDLKILRTSPLNSSRLYNQKSLPSIVAWKSKDEMQKRFEKMRDERFLHHPSDAKFPRRISWMYPEDGCWIRASLFNRLAFQSFVPIPDKVFAFGNLRVKTKNSPRGVVGWWFHVAPIVRVEGTHFVLDPAIEPKHPLSLDEWLGRMGNPKKIKVSFCRGGAYSPGDSCADRTDGLEMSAYHGQKYYLDLEKRRLQGMGRDYKAELGDSPPWKN